MFNKDNINLAKSVIKKFKIHKDDIDNIILISIWRAKRNFKFKNAKFSTYLYRITENLCKKTVKDYKPSIVRVRKENSIDIDEYLEILENDEKDLIYKKYIYNYSVEEICKMQNCSKTVIYDKIQKSLNKIKRKYEYP